MAPVGQFRHLLVVTATLTDAYAADVNLWCVALVDLAKIAEQIVGPLIVGVRNNTPKRCGNLNKLVLLGGNEIRLAGLFVCREQLFTMGNQAFGGLCIF